MCIFALFFNLETYAYPGERDPPIQCGGNLTSLDTEIKSPLYPDAYPGGVECVWDFYMDKGQRVYLTFDDFEVDGHGDSVEVYDVDEKGTEIELIGNFSGNKGETCKYFPLFIFYYSCLVYKQIQRWS